MQPQHIDFPLGVFTDSNAARQAFYELVALSNEGRINLVAPTLEFHGLPPFRALSVSRLDPAPTDLFPLPGGGNGKKGILKRFLDRLKALRGIQVVDTVRVDGGAEDAVWEYKCTVDVPMLDGSSVRIQKSRSVDMRVGGPDLIAALGKDWKQKEQFWSQTRANGPALAQSKAQNRAIREALGIDAGMTEQAFMRPWAVVSLAAHIEASQMSQAARDAVGMSIALGGNPLYGKAAGEIYQRNMPQLVDRTPATEEQLPPAQGGQQGGQQDAAPQGQRAQGQGQQAAQADARASKATMEEVNAAFKAVGKEAFFRIAAGVFGEDSVPDGQTITEKQARMLLQAIRAHTDDPPF